MHGYSLIHNARKIVKSVFYLTSFNRWDILALLSLQHVTMAVTHFKSEFRDFDIGCNKNKNVSQCFIFVFKLEHLCWQSHET